MEPMHESQKVPIEVFSIGTSKLLLSRGTSLRVLKLLRGLAAHSDIKLRIVSSDETNPVPGAEHIKISGNFWSMSQQVRESLKQRDAAIIVGHTINSLRFLFLLRFFSKAKLFLEVHGFIAEEAYFLRKLGKIRYYINSSIHKVLFWWCDLVTTTSPTGTRMVSHFNKNAHTLFNGADEALFNPKVQPGYNFKVNPQDIVIGYAGNSQTYQGLDFLKKSFEQLITKDARFKLALLLSDYKEDQTISSNVFVVAGLPHEKVPSFLASCDVLVVPRLDNRVTRISFASKILEYMAMGKPVVSSDIGDANTVINSKENGVLYAPGDTAGFLHALEYLGSEGNRGEIGQKARKTVIGSYTNAHLQTHFYELIRKNSLNEKSGDRNKEGDYN